jgi:hypothetical protein
MNVWSVLPRAGGPTTARPPASRRVLADQRPTLAGERTSARRPAAEARRQRPTSVTGGGQQPGDTEPTGAGGTPEGEAHQEGDHDAAAGGEPQCGCGPRPTTGTSTRRPDAGDGMVGRRGPRQRALDRRRGYGRTPGAAPGRHGKTDYSGAVGTPGGGAPRGRRGPTRVCHANLLATGPATRLRSSSEAQPTRGSGGCSPGRHRGPTTTLTQGQHATSAGTGAGCGSN